MIDDLSELHTLLGLLADAGKETQADNRIVNGETDVTATDIELLLTNARTRCDTARIELWQLDAMNTTTTTVRKHR
jgi:hypothetical protein